MLFFGYGSLLNEDSVKETMPTSEVVGWDYLSGYRRIFNFKSPYRHNRETGIYSAVLNLEPAETYIAGALIKVEEKELDELLVRERGYEMMVAKTGSGHAVHTFLSRENTDYSFIENDPVQEEYLELCLRGAKQLNDKVYENFLDTTLLNDRTVREYLHS